MGHSRTGLLLALFLAVLWPEPALAQPSCTFEQITDSAAGGSFQPSISASGTAVAFTSSSDLTGGNADGNFEVFLSGGALTQVTDSTQSFNFVPAISADGTRMAFISSSDLTGDNPDGGYEIFLFDAITSTLTQITSSLELATEPSINADGTRISFHSSSDLTGNNSDGSDEIFLFDAATGTLTQITSAIAGDSVGSSISADGKRIAFISNSNLTGGNPDGNVEVLVFDTATSALTQITDSAQGGSVGPSINAGGTRSLYV